MAVEARLDGTVALITGASSGIGAATARALAKQGAAVALAARREERLAQVAQDIARDGGHAMTLVTDLTEKAHATAAVEHTVAEWGRLDILVNSAGVALLGPIESAPLDEWEQTIRVNLMGLLYTAHAALPHLLQTAENAPRQVADLVNISSTEGRVARRDVGVYAATKFGVRAFSESLRQEVTGRHVRVSVVEPGTVATDILSHGRAEVLQPYLQRLSGVELLAAEDIADAIEYIVTRPRRVAVNELLIRPTEEYW